jgi:hypothetical protein
VAFQHRDEGLLEMGRGRAIVVAGKPERSAVVTKMKELLELGRRSGYRREEVVAAASRPTVMAF